MQLLLVHPSYKNEIGSHLLIYQISWGQMAWVYTMPQKEDKIILLILTDTVEGKFDAKMAGSRS